MNSIAAPPAGPTPGPLRLAGDPRLLWKRQVITITSVAGDESSSAGGNKAASTATKVPVGPIIGGIVAGVAVVLLIAGTWWYCHRKSEKEREARRHRRRNRARANTNTSRPSISARPSGASLATLNKGATSHHGFAGQDEKVPPVPALPATAYVLPHQSAGRDAPRGQTWDDRGQYQQQYPQQYQQAAVVLGQPVDTSPFGQSIDNDGGLSSSVSGESTTPVNHNGGSATGGSTSRGGSRSNKSRTRHIRENQPSAAANGYQPVKPSPLAAAARAAREKSEEDTGPRWGEGPFRSPTSADEHSRQREEAWSGAQQSDHASGQAMTSPTRTGFDDNGPGGNPITDRQQSGEWGVSYANTAYQSEPARPQPARTAYQYDGSHRSPQRHVSGHQDDSSMAGQAAYAYEPEYPPSAAQDPYAAAAYRAAHGGEDPYADQPSSPRSYGRM